MNHTRTKQAALLCFFGAAAIPTTQAAAQLPGYTLLPGFVQTFPGYDGIQVNDRNVNGGVFANMDADPELEYVTQSRDMMYAINPDGTFVPGWPAVVGDLAGFPPAVGDVDGDGEDEIVTATFFFGRRSFLRVYEKDGTLNPTFNFQIGAMGGGSVSLANLDADPALEILTSETFRNPIGGDVVAYDNDGSFLPGFPIALNLLQPASDPAAPNQEEFPSSATPSVGDIDNDGQVEIVVPSNFGVYAFETSGTLMPGFPIDVRTVEPDRQMYDFGAVSLVDLDGNGDLELVFASAPYIGVGASFPVGGASVHVHNHDGTVFPGWPVTWVNTNIDPNNQGSVGFRMPISVADIDLDGRYDILLGDALLSVTPSSFYYAFESDGTVKPGFPITAPAQIQMSMVANLDTDPEMEIVLWDNTNSGSSWVINHDGTRDPAWTFPTLLQDPSTPFDGPGVPTIADYDLNGTLDIMWLTNNITGNPAATGFPRDEAVTTFYLFSGTNAFNAQNAQVPSYGYNNQNTFLVPPLVTLPVCLGDWDGNGPVDGDDIDAFGDDFDAGLTIADLNLGGFGDGSYDIFDWLFFLNAVQVGCD